jgi:hypothetical protein
MPGVTDKNKKRILSNKIEARVGFSVRGGDLRALKTV